jgi:hypothetical protein
VFQQVAHPYTSTCIHPHVRALLYSAAVLEVLALVDWRKEAPTLLNLAELLIKPTVQAPT